MKPKKLKMIDLEEGPNASPSDMYSEPIFPFKCVSKQTIPTMYQVFQDFSDSKWSPGPEKVN